MRVIKAGFISVLAILLFLPIHAKAEQVDIVGNLDIVIIDHVDGDHAVEYFLESPDGSYRLTFQNPSLIEDLGTGDRLKITGNRQGDDTIMVSALNVLFSAASAAKPMMTGDRSIAVFLVNFSDDPSKVVKSVADAEDFMFDDISNWFQEVSYDKVTFSGDVFGIYTLPITKNQATNYWQIKSKTIEMARANGIEPYDYQHQMYVFPRISVGWAGLASVGGGYSYINSYFDMRVTTHELGHNLGLWHANGIDCGDNVLLEPLADNCRTYEYRDPYDSMGSARPYHFNAGFKERLQWFNEGNLVDVAQSGTYTLEPYETNTTGTKALKIATVFDGNQHNNYFVEYRQKIGVDERISNDNVVNGALIHLYNGSGMLGVSGSVLLDIHHSTHVNHSDAGLRVGESYTEPGLGITFTALSNDASGLQIQIDLNEDNLNGIVEVNERVITTSENEASVEVTVTRKAGLKGAVSVDYETIDSGAKAGEDYVAQNGTLQWNDQQMGEQKIIIPIINDTESEWTESLQLRLSSPQGGVLIGKNNYSFIQIEDNDFGVTVDAGPGATVKIGESFQLQPIVSNDNPMNTGLHFRWDTTHGPTAAQLTDETSLTPNVTFPLAGTYELMLNVFVERGVSVVGPVTDKTIFTVAHTPRSKETGAFKNVFNPARGEMIDLAWSQEEESPVRVTVSDRLGQEVYVVADEERPAGLNVAAWHGRNHSGTTVASGIYTVLFNVGGSFQSKRIAVIK